MKHSIGEHVRHSLYGDGTVEAARQETRTPPPIDTLALRREELNLRARLAEIEATLARGTAPYTEDVYDVVFADGRRLSFGELGLDKLRERWQAYPTLAAQVEGVRND